MKKFYNFLKKYHRCILWIVFGFLFLGLDMITTLLGVKIGLHEGSLFLSQYVGNPILLLGVKIAIFVIFFIFVEGVIFILNKIPYDKNWTIFIKLVYNFIYYLPYAMFILVLIAFIWYLWTVQVSNIQCILSPHTCLS